MQEENAEPNPTTESLCNRAVRSWSGCLIWSGPRTKAGYPFIKLNKRNTYVTRVILAKAVGRPLGRFEYACHHCDNPGCIEPTHLFVGSPKDNSQDMKRKGRAVAGPGLPRQSFCKRGHPLAGDNIGRVMLKNGREQHFCRKCVTEYKRKWFQDKQKEKRQTHV